MCEHCGSIDRSVEVTPENRPDMIREASLVALHAAAAYSNGWIKGARGLYEDIADKWGAEGHLRMLYVWASARYFLPPDAEAGPLAPGYSDLERLSREISDKEPDPQYLARLVAINDQAGAAAQALTEAASKGDLEAMEQILGGLEDTDHAGAVPALLMTDAGYRMAHAKATDNDTAVQLFNAHVRALFPAEDGE